MTTDSRESRRDPFFESLDANQRVKTAETAWYANTRSIVRCSMKLSGYKLSE
jgi:hypothetical protein